MNTFEVNYTVYGEAQEPILITVSAVWRQFVKHFGKALSLIIGKIVLK